MADENTVATEGYYYNLPDGSSSWYVYPGETPMTARYAPWNIQAWIEAENERARLQAIANGHWQEQLNEQINAGGPITVTPSPPFIPIVLPPPATPWIDVPESDTPPPPAAADSFPTGLVLTALYYLFSR